MDEGKQLEEVKYTEELDCERLCNGNSLCKSFAYCPGEMICYLRDKMVDEETQLNINRLDDCRTHYRSCGNFKFISLFH